MPVRRKREKRVVQTLTRRGGQLIRYGFNSGVDSSDATTLGQVELDSVTSDIVWFGVNSPKPARFRKITAAGSTESFCSVNSRVDAFSAGWVESRSAIYSAPGSTNKTTLVGVDMGGGEYYCWNIDTADHGSYGADMGMKIVTKTDEIIIGAQRPKPPRVYRRVAGTGDDGSRIQTSFIEPGKDIPAGWKELKGSEKNPWNGDDAPATP